MSCCGGCFAGATKVVTKEPVAEATKEATEKPSHELRRTLTQKNESFEKTLEWISHIPLFQQIPPEHLPAVAKSFNTRVYTDGEHIFEQGDMGNEFYVIGKGKAAVLVDGHMAGILGKGDFFGEGSMLHGAPHRATVTATEGDVVCLALSREDFNKLHLRKELNFKRRKAMVIQDTPDTYRFVPPKTPEEEKFIKESFMSDSFIGDYFKDCKVVSSALQEICMSAFHDKVAKGTTLMKQGDVQADLFYMLQSGTAEVFKDGEKVASYKDGGSFGGHALVLQTPRTVTVQITSDSEVWCIPRSAMRHVLQQHVKARVARFKKILDKVELFNDLEEKEKDLLADALLETTYTKGHLVTKQGEDPQAFFILEAGEVSEVENGVEKPSLKADGLTCEHLPYFGERALVEDHAYYCTREVLSDKATFCVLRREVCQRVLKCHDHHEAHLRDRVEYKMSELSTKALLGCGGFGKVTLETYEPTGQMFALKKISKGHLVAGKNKSKKRQIMNEKRTMRMCHSQFLVQCAATFNSEQYLYFLLEPVLGGELHHLYKVHDLHGREDLARFYSACVAKGFEHLHERSIIYRDLKQENLLLDSKGYCKITDFGLAKFCIGKTFTICGTAEFFAPEMIKSVGHTTSLDWWTLGIMIYELMMGCTPWEAKDLAGLVPKIMKGLDATPLPKTRSWALFVKELCKFEPCERLPVKPGGVTNLAGHKWYKDAGFDFAELVTGQMTAPFIPEEADADHAAKNFDADGQDAPEEVQYIDKGDGWDKGFEDPWGPASFDHSDTHPKKQPPRPTKEDEEMQAPARTTSQNSMKAFMMMKQKKIEEAQPAMHGEANSSGPLAGA